MQIIGDIVGLIIIGWTTQLNIIMIESIILWIFAIAISLYEFRNAKLST